MGRRSRVFLACFGAVWLALAAPSRAHIVVEEPWHPAAAAYRTMLFLADLDPVMWDLAREALDRAHPAAASPRPARVYFEALAPDRGVAPPAAIDRAIADQDRQALYAAATRAVSALVRHLLGEAAAALTVPGGAHLKVLEAQSVYRGFADFVAQADPAGGRSLGLAWLDLTSSVGSQGVLGSGAAAPDPAAFAAARAIVEDYLVANFEPARFAPRVRLTPLPETVVAARGEVRVRPWLPPGAGLNDQTPLPRLVLNFEQQGIDEATLPLIAYGDMLFDSPLIFGEPARSLGIACSTCHNRSDINQAFAIPGISHQPGAADVDGSFFNAIFNDRRSDSLDIPSLRGIRFTGPYGRDGRFASLRDFVRNVVVNEFAGAEPTPFMLDALIAYVLEFDFLPNRRIDGAGRLTEAASAAERRGEALFNRPFTGMDGKSCATCHQPSASFLDRMAHDIGSGPASYPGGRDGAFDTPTLLGARFTAPYFHDGSLPTLASVVGWFDERHRLGLTAPERADLLAYLDAVGDADAPYEAFDARNTPFRLGWEELTTFASTLQALLPRRDAFHARLMIDTVAADLARDASAMANLAAKPQVYELAAILADIGRAVAADDWDLAQREWDRFKAVQAQIDPEMF